MKRFCIAFSEKENQEEAYQEIFTSIKESGRSPILIILFSSNSLIWYCSSYLKKEFPSSTIIGTSSQRSFTSLEQTKSGISALAIFSGIEVQSGILFEVQRHPRNYINHLRIALNKFSSYENMCCLEFVTAFTKGEELVLDSFNYLLKDLNVPVFGGSAGCDYGVKNTVVALDGELYQNSCVFVLIKNLCGSFNFYKENIFVKKGISLIPTDVDCDEQIVYEFDNCPAADILSEKLGISLDKLQGELANFPLGRFVKDGDYILQPGVINKDGSISYYCKIYNHEKVEILEMGDLKKIWSKTQKDIKSIINKDSIVIVISCASQCMYYEKNNLLKDYLENLKAISENVFGFCGFGEQFKSININQSMIVMIIN